MSDDRAQVFTLEGLLAALVVLAGLVFALQAVVVTPSNSGATGAGVDVAQVDSVLSETADNGTLERAVLAADEDGYTAVRGFYVEEYPPNAFGRTLNGSFGPTVAVNVVVHYRESGSIESQRMIYNGAPGPGATRASTSIALFDGETTESDFFANDASPDTGMYNVVEVEVVAWQT